ncbi:hypothetical protein H257_17721 [Aphanomyces astaci]|uniref:Uncharacterized protein n=1 Tax=Aphanomyces astaci TaxID=112090 RepID=W4FDQ5_APHAT|nr:hypothetical protein H257_17721 [Aphanomyces astaci]ETV65612.1 hypothetical protein H257_17721 [Aphanomyces astaci]|eukprot:XP_009844909.1 hypothetical protein H257_17721 [Aphanomyces astaci]
MERCMRLLNPSILGCPALHQVEAMNNQAFGPTLESERVRAKLLRYIRHILDQGQCSYSITPSGSYPLKTYLPDSDIDMCLEVPDAAATWHLAVTQALIGAATPAAAESGGSRESFTLEDAGGSGVEEDGGRVVVAESAEERWKKDERFGTCSIQQMDVMEKRDV